MFLPHSLQIYLRNKISLIIDIVNTFIVTRYTYKIFKKYSYLKIFLLHSLQIYLRNKISLIIDSMNT